MLIFSLNKYITKYIIRNRKKKPRVIGIQTGLTWLRWFGFRFKPISGNGLKIVAYLKRDKSDTQKIILLLLQRIQSKPLTHCISFSNISFCTFPGLFLFGSNHQYNIRICSSVVIVGSVCRQTSFTQIMASPSPSSAFS